MGSTITMAKPDMQKSVVLPTQRGEKGPIPLAAAQSRHGPVHATYDTRNAAVVLEGYAVPAAVASQQVLYQGPGMDRPITGTLAPLDARLNFFGTNPESALMESKAQMPRDGRAVPMYLAGISEGHKLYSAQSRLYLTLEQVLDGNGLAIFSAHDGFGNFKPANFEAIVNRGRERIALSASRDPHPVEQGDTLTIETRGSSTSETSKLLAKYRMHVVLNYTVENGKVVPDALPKSTRPDPARCKSVEELRPGQLALHVEGAREMKTLRTAAGNAVRSNLALANSGWAVMADLGEVFADPNVMFYGVGFGMDEAVMKGWIPGVDRYVSGVMSTAQRAGERTIPVAPTGSLMRWDMLVYDAGVLKEHPDSIRPASGIILVTRSGDVRFYDAGISTAEKAVLMLPDGRDKTRGSYTGDLRSLDDLPKLPSGSGLMPVPQSIGKPLVAQGRTRSLPSQLTLLVDYNPQNFQPPELRSPRTPQPTQAQDAGVVKSLDELLNL